VTFIGFPAPDDFNPRETSDTERRKARILRAVRAEGAWQRAQDGRWHVQVPMHSRLRVFIQVGRRYFTSVAALAAWRGLDGSMYQ
jgi:hypothetical protein